MSSSDWMGRYRPLVSALVQHSNLFAHSGAKLEAVPGCVLSSQEWQTLEYLIEQNQRAFDLGLNAVK